MHEHAHLYQAFGMELHTQPATHAELGEECYDCRLMICRLVVTVYIRRSAPLANEAAVVPEAGRRND